MDIVFVNQVSSTARIPQEVIRALRKRINKLFKRKIQSKVISVVFVSSGVSKKLNSEYRNKARATNVLSFVSPEKKELGDIVICPQIAKREAESIGVGFNWWVGYLFVHGTLHLLGYDHKTTKEENKMEALAKKILN